MMDRIKDFFCCQFMDFENIFFNDRFSRLSGFDIIKHFHIVFEFLFVSGSGLDFFSSKKLFSILIGDSVSFDFGRIHSATKSCDSFELLLSFRNDVGIFDDSSNAIDLFYAGDDGVGDGEVDHVCLIN